MKTIILCGGRGTRLKEETEYRPKPMVTIGAKPIIWHIMKLYAHFGYNEFILALGYKADYIKHFFLNQKALTSDFTLDTKTHATVFHHSSRTESDTFKITFVDTGLDTLPGERIRRCERYIPVADRNFMVTYGDGVADIPIDALVSFHKKQGKLATITGVHPRSKYGKITVNTENCVTRFTEKPVLRDWVNGGFMICNRSVLSEIIEGETELELLIRLSQKRQLSMYSHDGFWFAVDTYKELTDLNDMWNNHVRPWMIWEH